METKVATFKLTFNIPPGCNRADVEEYVKNAITGWGGAFSPDDPFFDVNDDIDFTLGIYRKGKADA